MDEFTKTRVIKIMEGYIKDWIPKHLQNQIKINYKIRGNNVTLIEERPAFRSQEWVQREIAQFRKDQEKWKVYWMDSKKRWHYIEEIDPNENFETQLKIVDKDDRGVFWG